uniref:EF-hand domain-containing protein n=1 Tax=Clytia hemisphaerica TaxID=252671 RepID=A0A7M5V705_9CNID
MYEDGEGVLSIDDFRRALKSEHCMAVRRCITNLQEQYGNTPKKYSPSMTTFTNCRDAILLILVVPNISRASAVANITLEEYKNATVTATGKSSILVKKHKTAKDYGPA